MGVAQTYLISKRYHYIGIGAITSVSVKGSLWKQTRIKRLVDSIVPKNRNKNIFYHYFFGSKVF